MVTPRTTPTRTAAAITPQNEPRPPITTTTNAAVRISAPIAGCTPAIGASSTPPGQPTPERGDCGQVRRERNAERADHVGVLHARAYHAAEWGAIDDEPGRRHSGDRDGQNDETVSRVDEVADEDLSAQLRRDRERQ